MKKFKILIVFLMTFLLFGCGKPKKENIPNEFIKKVHNLESYSINGIMEIVSNEETYSYDVIVEYKKKDNYKVQLINKINNHKQVILKNNDGVYVVTPALNKSFKFQSDWPQNSSQSYILESIIKDIESTKDKKVDENSDYYIVESKVSYVNNKNLQKEKIYFNKKGELKEIQVLNKDGNAVIRMKFNKINYSPKLDDKTFDLNTLIVKNDCNEDDCKKEDTKETGILKDVIYPLYLPADTHLSTKDTVDTDNGERVIMTYAGAKPFMLIEETASVNKDLEVTNVYGDPFLLSTAVGAMTENSLEWHNNNMEYYLTSSYLTKEELTTIAESLNTAAVVETVNK